MSERRTSRVNLGEKQIKNIVAEIQAVAAFVISGAGVLPPWYTNCKAKSKNPTTCKYLDVLFLLYLGNFRCFILGICF